MNIGILLPGFSGDETDWAIPVQLNLVRELAKTDDVRVLALRYPHRRDSYMVYGARVYSLGVGQVRGFRRLLLWRDALITLRRLHAEKPFDVLHAMWADETGLIAAWAGHWLDIPVVVSVAGGELARLHDIGYGLGRGRFSRWVVGQALRGADRIIIGCLYIGRLIAQSDYNILPHKICTIPLGVDTSLFRPPAIPNPHNRRLIHAASLIKVKDQTALLRAVARLEGVTLDILGKGPERPALESLAADLGIARRVNFLGEISHTDLPKYYQNAAVNVLTSRHEGLGMVTLEAAACGLPTVSTAVGLLPDHPALGLSVPVGDDAALAEAVNTLLSNPDRYASLSQSARNLVERQFTIQHTATNFRALYRQLRQEKARIS